MHKTWALHLAILLPVLAVIAGCGGGRDQQTDAQKAAMVNFVKAVRAADREAFLKTCAYDAKESDEAKALFDLMVARDEFIRALAEQYGESVIPPAHRAALLSPEAFAGKVEIRQENGLTVAALEGYGAPVPLTEQDGAWKVHLRMMLKMVITLGPDAAGIRKKAAAVRELRKKIGREGIEPGELMDEASGLLRLVG